MLKNQKICMMRERLELAVKRLCGRIPPDRRVWVILAMLVLFGVGSIYMTVSSIYNYGKRRGLVEYFYNKMEIERLRSMSRLPEPEPEPEPETATDSLNLETLYDYEPGTDE